MPRGDISGLLRKPKAATRSDPFVGIRLKLSRALNQIQSLERDTLAFIHQKQPYGVRVQFDRSTGIVTVRAEIAYSPDPMWGVLIGEIVHNLRSALDHLVWELVIKHTGKPPNLPAKQQFPVFLTEKGNQAFDGRGVPVMLKDVSSQAVELIRKEQPFGTGEGIKSPLWHLSELSNADKHRTLHLTGTLLHEIHLTFPPLKINCRAVTLEARQSGPIQQDAVLRRIQFVGVREWPFTSREINGNVSCAIAFDERTPAVGGWIVLQTLVDIYNRVLRVSSQIGKDIFAIDI